MITHAAIEPVYTVTMSPQKEFANTLLTIIGIIALVALAVYFLAPGLKSRVGNSFKTYRLPPASNANL